MLKGKLGFTLIELLIVITVIGLIGAVGLGAYAVSQQRARDAKRQSDLSTLRNSLEIYYADKRTYATTGGIWQDASTALSGLVPSYIKTMPADPKPGTSPYRYLDTTSGQGYCLEAALEVNAGQNTCLVPLEPSYNYGVGNP